MTAALNWQALIAEGKADPWHEDRLRKFTHIASEAKTLQALAKKLTDLGGVTKCTPELLALMPEAADWFVALAAYSQKTVREKSSAQRAAGHGLPISPTTFVTRLKSRSMTTSRERAAFSRWVNAEIAELFHNRVPNDPALLTLHVAMIVGARIVGQGQNEGGASAVVLLKRALLEQVEGAHRWTGEHNGAVELDLVTATVWTHKATRCRFDFRAGGNRPDLSVYRAGQDIPALVAEVKGRKDLSNTWESWMPQVADHLRTWKEDWPSASRGVFMTMVTREMVEGVSVRGVRRTGLKQLAQAGQLDFVYNLTQMQAAKNESFIQTIRSAMR